MTRTSYNLSVLLMVSLLSPCASQAANTAAAARSASAPESSLAYAADYGFYLKKLDENRQKKSLVASEVHRFRSYPYLERAYRLINQRRYGEAKKDLAAYIAMSPDDVRARLSYLEILNKMSLQEEVVIQADQLIARWPGLVPAHIFKGVALQRMQKPDMAYATFSSVAAMDDIRSEDKVFALSMAADLAANMGHYGDALKNLTTLNALDKKHASLMRTGYLHEKMNSPKEALNAYTEARSLARTASEKNAALLALARLYSSLKEWEPARQSFTALRQIEPRNREALRGLAQIAYLQKQSAEAEKLMVQIDQGALRPEDHELLANLYLQKQDHNAAIKELRIVVALQGNNVPVGTLSSLAQEYETVGRLQESESTYRSLIGKSAKNSELHFRHGALLMKMERYRDAESSFLKAISLGLSDQRRGDAHRNLALIYEKQARYDLAARELENSLRYRLPDQDETRISLARVLSLSHQDAGALRYLDEVLNGTSAAERLKRTAHLEKSVIYERLGRFPEAADEFEKAAAFGGEESGEILIKRATLLGAAGRTDDALRRLDQALSIKGLPKEQQSRAYRQRGVILEKNGQPAKAAQDFERVVALGDSSPGMYLGLAQLYQAANDPEKAAVNFAKVLNATGASKSETCTAQDSLGMLTLAQGRVAEATQQLSGALTLCGKSWQRHYYLGLAYYRDKQWQLATEQLLQADAIRKDAATLLHIALCHKELNKRGTAIHYLQLALQESGNDPVVLRKQILDTLGYSYADESSYDRAADAFAQSLALVPDNTVSLRHAYVLSRADRASEAWKALETVDPSRLSPPVKAEYNDVKAALLQKKGKNEEALLAMEENQQLAASASRSYETGLLCHKLGLKQKAESYLRTAYEKEPDNTEYALALGYAYAANERYPEAAVLFERVVERHPDFAKVYEDLGYLHMKAGDNQQAVKRFKQALDRHPSASEAASGESELWRKDAERINGEIAKLTNVINGVAYWSYRSGNARNTVLVPGGQTSGGLTGEVGIEASFRPPVIGFRDDRIFEIFGRVFGNQKNDSVSYNDTSTQAAIGVRYKPLQSENLWLSAERLLKIGDYALDDWLFRLLYSRGNGFSPVFGTFSQDYTLLYGEVDYYVRNDTTAAHLEARKGAAFTFRGAYMLIPHLVADASWQTPFSAGSIYLEGGPGVLLRYFFNGTRYKNYRNIIDLSATYKHGIFFDKGFQKKTAEYDSGILSIGLSF